MNKIFIKRIIGALVVVHIIPVICVVVFAANPGETAPIAPYFLGWFFNSIVAMMFGLIKFIQWCFS